MAKIFLSYAHEDEAQVIRLEESLRQAGHHIWRDRTAIQAGDRFLAKINEALAEAEIVVACLSKAALESSWADQEREAALVREEAGHLRLILVRMQEVQPPPLLAIRLRVDLFPEERWADGVRELLRAVGTAEMRERPLPAATELAVPLPEAPHALAEDPLHDLVRGMTELPDNVAHRIENFLRHYIGSEARRGAPFGGRAGVLRELDAWLSVGTEPPYRLLLAPGGKGKSALLAQWVARLATRAAWAVAYVPVSVRFQTNLSGTLFSALGARLAFLRGEAVPSSRDMTLEIWRRLISDALSRPLKDGRPLLVIIDGIDEAADLELGPALFPQAPPSGLRVLLSAREMMGWNAVRWRQELGWEHPWLASVMGLERLDLEGVREVIEQLGPPLGERARDLEFVAEMFRLTQGEPLVLSLYLTEWEGQGASVQEPAELKGLRPSLTGYFERWWNEQRKLWGADAAQHERRVRNLLGVLSCALGPLGRDELLHLLQAETDLDLAEMMRPLARFILGNGRDQGYTFTHPALGAYFAEQLSETERRRWKARFVEWGEETLDALEAGKLSAEEVSPYLLQYLGAHFEGARCGADALLRLVSDGWRRAVEAHDPSHASLLLDIDRASRAVRREDEASAGRVAPLAVASGLRCAVARSGVRALAQDIPPLLLRMLVEHGVWTFSQGEAYARQVPGVVMRVVALMALAKTGRGEQAECLREALEQALAASLDEQEQALRVLSPHLPSDLADRAIEAARKRKPSLDRAILLAILANHRSEPVQEELVQEIVSSLSGERPTAHRLALAELDATLLQRHGIQGIESRAFRLPGDLSAALSQLLGDKQSMSKGVQQLHNAWNRYAVEPARLPDALAEDVLPRLVAVALGLQDEFALAVAIELLSPWLDSKQRDEAMRVASGITYLAVQAKVRAVVAGVMPAPQREGRLHEALSSARKLQDSGLLVETCIGVAAVLPGSKKAVILPELIARTRGRFPRSPLLARLASVSEEPTRTELLNEALVEVSARGALPEWEEFLQNLGDATGHPRVWDVMRGLTPELRRDIFANSMDALARFMLEEFFADALSAMFAHAKGWLARSALKQLAPRLPPSLQAQVLEVSAQSGENGEPVGTLVTLLPTLAEHLLPRARELAERCTGNDRALALGVLVPRMPASQRPPMLKEVLETLRIESSNHHLGAEVLLQIIPVLPDDMADKMIRLAQSLEPLDLRADVLAALAIRFPGNRNLRAAAISCSMIYEPFWSEEPLLLLASHIPPSLQPELFRIAREQEDPEARAMLLGALAKTGESPQHLAALEDAFREACHANSRGAAFQLLAPKLPRLSHERLRRLWYEGLPILSSRPRMELLLDIKALAPVLLFLGGEEEMIRIIRTLLDVGSWWS